MMGKVISISCCEVIVSWAVFSLSIEDKRLLCGKGALKLNVHYKKCMPHSAPCIPTPCAGHTASCCSPLLTCSFFLEEKPNEQGNRVLSCLLAWTTWARAIEDTPYPERPEKILKRQFGKALQWPPRVSFSATCLSETSPSRSPIVLQLWWSISKCLSHCMSSLSAWTITTCTSLFPFGCHTFSALLFPKAVEDKTLGD